MPPCAQFLVTGLEASHLTSHWLHGPQWRSKGGKWRLINTLFQPFKNVLLSRNLDCLKMRIFWKKLLKSPQRQSSAPESPLSLTRLEDQPHIPDCYSRLLLQHFVECVTIVLKVIYYYWKRINITTTNVLHLLLHLFFLSNSAVCC